uniref:Uncharacterized protein n=1 Tax=Meloidogyne javanica TaxID=6303 RepID=A0A915LBR6_MELJA
MLKQFLTNFIFIYILLPSTSFAIQREREKEKQLLINEIGIIENLVKERQEECKKDPIWNSFPEWIFKFQFLTLSEGINKNGQCIVTDMLSNKKIADLGAIVDFVKHGFHKSLENTKKTNDSTSPMKHGHESSSSFSIPSKVTKIESIEQALAELEKLVFKDEDEKSVNRLSNNVYKLVLNSREKLDNMIKNLKIQFLIGQDPGEFILLKKEIENGAKSIVDRIDSKLVADIEKAKLKLRSELYNAENFKNENLAEEIIQNDDAEGFKKKYTERFKKITRVAKNGIFEYVPLDEDFELEKHLRKYNDHTDATNGGAFVRCFKSYMEVVKLLKEYHDIITERINNADSTLEKEAVDEIKNYEVHVSCYHFYKILGAMYHILKVIAWSTPQTLTYNENIAKLYVMRNELLPKILEKLDTSEDTLDKDIKLFREVAQNKAHMQYKRMMDKQNMEGYAPGRTNFAGNFINTEENQFTNSVRAQFELKINAGIIIKNILMVYAVMDIHYNFSRNLNEPPNLLDDKIGYKTMLENARVDINVKKQMEIIPDAKWKTVKLIESMLMIEQEKEKNKH